MATHCVKQELRRKANVLRVKVGRPPGETAGQLRRELAAEVVVLRQYSLIGRSIRVECRNREGQNFLLNSNGCYLQMDGGLHQLKVQLTEPQWTVYELRKITDQRVEELEEMGAINLDLVPTAVYPVQMVELEATISLPQLDMTSKPTENSLLMGPSPSHTETTAGRQGRRRRQGSGRGKAPGKGQRKNGWGVLPRRPVGGVRPTP